MNADASPRLWVFVSECGDEIFTVLHKIFVVGVSAIPLKHGEFWIVTWAADLAVAEDFGDVEDIAESFAEEFLHLKLGRGVEIHLMVAAIWCAQAGLERVEMWLHSWRRRHDRRLNFQEILGIKEVSNFLEIETSFFCYLNAVVHLHFVDVDEAEDS